MKRPTMHDVARAAGVSVGTVSNVLNALPSVRPETRARVQAAIGELRYRPDTLARTLISRRNRGPARPEAEPGAPRLVVVGYVSVDYTAWLDILPHRDDRVTATTIDKGLGGPAANVAMTAAGATPRHAVRTELFTSIGDDADSDWGAGGAGRGAGRHGRRPAPRGRAAVALHRAGRTRRRADHRERANLPRARRPGRLPRLRRRPDRPHQRPSRRLPGRDLRRHHAKGARAGVPKLGPCDGPPGGLAVDRGPSAPADALRRRRPEHRGGRRRVRRRALGGGALRAGPVPSPARARRMPWGRA